MSAAPASFISPAAAYRLVEADAVSVIDCRFRLSDPDWGRASYAQSHLPGAGYAHLDQDLACLAAGPGRHPLPQMADFHRCLRRWGVRPDRPVVVYDDAAGAIAARLWWLLRYVGHRQVRILDGGLQAWLDAGLPVGSEIARPQPSEAEFAGKAMAALDVAEIQARINSAGTLLIDARSQPRFAGIQEPIDAVAGHVPGALNRPFEANLEHGRLLPIPGLVVQWQQLLGAHRPAEVIHMCGSGVTACFNLACMEHLGLSGSALFVPSWSGWIADPQRPVATGLR